MGRPDDIAITESWNDKNYEYKLTDFFFSVMETIRITTYMPTYDNLKKAFSDVKGYSNTLLYSDHFLKKYKNDIKPVLDMVEIALFGQPGNEEVIKVWETLGITISKNRHGETKVTNAQRIISELSGVMFILKQFTYEQGFFAKKPKERIYGKAGIEAVGEM